MLPSLTSKPAILLLLAALAASAQTLNCDLREYHQADGLRAAMANNELQLTWQGERGEELRAAFAIRDAQPTIRELAIHRPGAAWSTLARDLTPEFDVVSGRRRLSEQQMAPLRALGIQLTPEVVEREKWNAFWDAPLQIPGSPNTNLDLPRSAAEIRRASATYHSSSCRVKTEGARLEVTFPGLSMGIFAGDLRFTVYKGANLLRQEAIAQTQEQSVAYKYNAGLKGFAIGQNTRVEWQDVARSWQHYAFGGAANNDPVALHARNRLAILETGAGSIAVFPPPHKFFFAREIEVNLGYVWYRKDSESSCSFGIRQPEHEDEWRAYGVSDEVWKRRSDQARQDLNNFALYNAPPGTMQRMPVYYYLGAGDAQATQQQVLAYTHNDTYKPMPGYQVAVSHFHFHVNEELQDSHTLDLQPGWQPVLRALGINIAILADFHGDGHANPPARFEDQRAYFEGVRRLSDSDFLVLPGEEPDAKLGGHYMFLFPHPVYWTKAAGPYKSQDPKYGSVYHPTTAAQELQLLRDEQGVMWQTHPRTKGSAGYPDAVREWDHFRSDRFIGASYQSLPVDQSEQRICEKRCFGTLDDMNNWAGSKYLIAEGDTYTKYPDDETYPELEVNYVKLDKLPRFDEDWSPVLHALQSGDFFVTSGEVLIRGQGSTIMGRSRVLAFEVEWTFPLEFVELVWSDGEKTGRQIIPATDLAPFGSHWFSFPFDSTGKKWVRFAAWDSAGNGAFTQPVMLNMPK